MTETVRSGRTRRMVPVALAVVGALLVAVVAGGPGDDDGPALDPTSTGRLGTKALVLLLEEQGTKVSVTPAVPGPDVRVALVLEDNLNDEQVDDLQRWVEDGGTLVVTDPSSELVGSAAFEATEQGRLRPQCSLPALADVGPIDVAGAPLYRLPNSDSASDSDSGGGSGSDSDRVASPASTACFVEDIEGTKRQAAFLIATPHGRGTVVALGGPHPFVNDRLGKGDNSVLAVRLLAPETGGSVTILRPPGVGEGDKGLGDLIPRRVKLAILQLVLAFLAVCLWRARRLGRPVLEPQAVELAGSELVVAVGNLLQQAGRREQAAAVLRDDVRRTLAERLNLGRDTPVDVVADVAAARTRIDRETILHALGGDPPTTDAALVHLAQSTEAVHLEITHAP